MRYAINGPLSGALVITLLLTAACMASDETSPKNGPAARWDELERSLFPAPRESAHFQKQELLAHFLAVAEGAADFRQKHREGQSTAEVALLEARSLLRAAFLGNHAIHKRLEALVRSLENDPNLTRQEQFEIISFYERLLIRDIAQTPAERLHARREVAEYLVSQFPEQPGGHLELISIAEKLGPTQQRDVAVAIITNEASPFEARAKAKTIIDRSQLLGKSLADIAQTALGHDNFFERTREREILLYTWRSDDPRSIAVAKAQFAPPGTLLVGYSLDTDVAKARLAAIQEGLPGEQFFDERGTNAWLALLLLLERPGQVYRTDAIGRFTEMGSAIIEQPAGNIFSP